jgi:hypothetical protein
MPMPESVLIAGQGAASGCPTMHSTPALSVYRRRLAKLPAPGPGSVLELAAQRVPRVWRRKSLRNSGYSMIGQEGLPKRTYRTSVLFPVFGGVCLLTPKPKAVKRLPGSFRVSGARRIVT